VSTVKNYKSGIQL